MASFCGRNLNYYEIIDFNLSCYMIFMMLLIFAYSMLTVIYVFHNFIDLKISLQHIFIFNVIYVVATLKKVATMYFNRNLSFTTFHHLVVNKGFCCHDVSNCYVISALVHDVVHLFIYFFCRY